MRNDVALALAEKHIFQRIELSFTTKVYLIFLADAMESHSWVCRMIGF